MSTMRIRFAAIETINQRLLRALELLAPVGNLAIRLYVANVFWKSGLTKIASWETTVMLFTYEYQVPLLSPSLAAMLATFVELVFPVLLVFGLVSRFSALVLFVFNAMAVISYPDLNEAAREWHYAWGLMLLVPVLYGPGRLSLDYVIKRWWLRSDAPSAELRTGNL